MRKIILALLGFVVIVGAFFGAQAIASKKKKSKPEVKKLVQAVFVEKVENQNLPITITATGNLRAKRRVELFSEVQGVFLGSSKPFKTGQPFNKGAVLIRMDGSEYYASVQSAKSDMYNLITAIMPDLQLDYPDIFGKWQTYLASFDMNKSTPKLPDMSSDKEKFFITGRGIFGAYYKVKNLEQRLSKYVLYAPFKGVLTNAAVTQGTLIRSGQRLGEFIAPGIFEMEVAIGKAYSNLMKVGNKVTVAAIDNDNSYTGTVVRVNESIDPTTQTIITVVEIKDPSLKEGSYMEAQLRAKEATDVVALPRNLLQENNQVFVVRDSILDLMKVTPVHFSEKEVFIKGLPNGTLLVNKSVPGAFSGMLVKVQEEQELGQKAASAKNTAK